MNQKKSLFKVTIGIAMITFILTVTACSYSRTSTKDNAMNRAVILNNDNTNDERNRLLTEDIMFFKQELPKLHKNPFHRITQEEFNTRTNQLIDNIDQLNNSQVFTELNKIIASIGDAHTTINYWDGYSYPLQFWIFDGNVYVVNAGAGLEDMVYSQVQKIDGVDIDYVIEQLTTLISHENESWVLAMLPNYLQSPVYMVGLGIVQKESEAVFTVQKDGKVQDFTVSTHGNEESIEYIIKKTKDVLIGKYDRYYDYEYLPEHKAFYFEYNVCDDMDNQSFKDFNEELFLTMEENDVEKIIVDLRSNSGGDSEILKPFTKRLKSYISENVNTKVYILVGRNTFSSGMFAIYGVKEAVPDSVSVGEPTGGALDCYGEVKTIPLKNSQMPISYSTKYFEFSKNFSYKNDGVGTFLPDISIQSTIEDYKSGNDAVLEYVLSD